MIAAQHVCLIASSDIWAALPLRPCGRPKRKRTCPAIVSVNGGYRFRPALAEIVGWRRAWIASMISDGSMPCR
jgi:hypothetical protein